MNPTFIPNSLDAVNTAPVILLVDDNVEFLEILTRRFTRRGFIVVACSDAAAVEAVDRSSLDVAIIDRGLRGRDGIEVLKELKRHRAELAVIILSGNSEKRAVELALELGAFDYLPKPCSLADLEAVVHRALSSRHETNANSHTARQSAQPEDRNSV